MQQPLCLWWGQASDYGICNNSLSKIFFLFPSSPSSFEQFNILLTSRTKYAIMPRASDRYLCFPPNVISFSVSPYRLQTLLIISSIVMDFFSLCSVVGPGFYPIRNRTSKPFVILSGDRISNRVNRYSPFPQNPWVEGVGNRCNLLKIRMLKMVISRIDFSNNVFER